LDATVIISVPVPNSTKHRTVIEWLRENHTSLPPWLPPFTNTVECPHHPSGFIEVNLHQLVLELEENLNAEWEEAKREAYTHAEVLIDLTGGRIAELLAKKTRWTDNWARPRLYKALSQARWYGVVNPRRQLNRIANTAVAHDLLNTSLDYVVECVFLINRSYRSHKKWRLLDAFAMHQIPTNFEERVRKALQVDINSVADVGRRASLIESLLAELDGMAKDAFSYDQDPYVLACAHSYDDRDIRQRALH
jgi:hypothetical protein